MTLNSGEQKRHISADAPVAWDSIRRALEENGDWYRDVVEHSQDLLSVHNLDGRFLSINPVLARLLGYTVEEVLRKPMWDFVDPQFHAQFDGYLHEIERTGEARGLMTVVTRTGEQRIWEYHNTLRSEGVEKPIVRGIAHDVTERVRVAKRLREFESLVENLEEMIVVIDREYRCVIANRAFQRYMGLTIEPVVGRLAKELLNLETRMKNELDECFRGKVVRHEFKYGNRGPERDLSITYLPLESATEIDRVACVIRDVTEQKQTEVALRQSEERERGRAQELETVLDAVPVAVCIAYDAECRRMTGNRVAHEQTRVPVGTNFSKSAPPEEQPGFRLMDGGVEIPTDLLPMQQAAATGKPVYGRAVTLVFEDGTERETVVNAVPLLDEEGKSRGVVGTSIDRTEQKQAEKALRESELRFRAVYERSPVGIALVDSRTGRFRQVNPKYCEIVGRSEREMLLIHVGSVTHPDDVESGNEHLKQLAGENVANCEMAKRYVRPDGSVRWVRIQAVPMGSTGSTHRCHLALVEDITERRQVEEEIAALVQQLREAKNKLSEEKLYLEQTIDTKLGFGEIIGKSKVLQSIMGQVGTVAVCDATVLILGETGTGKELIARAIHRLSQRANNSFIKLNCAAIPLGLLESELFGNEKGAFTGAVSKKIGRFELADKGTLFLDEVGEVPLELQPKLLRVLQDQEFERLGGVQTLRVNFRLIAATNRDLAAGMRENEFRSDLYYRLNVFPIRVPPLRERREDIPLLVEHFLQKCARRMNKQITSIPKGTMDVLINWKWPGNVRELENFIERSVILTQGSVLVAPLTELELIVAGEKTTDETLEAKEREHILRVLWDSHGQIGGPKGAATRLGLKRTTLQGILKHLGINPRLPPPEW